MVRRRCRPGHLVLEEPLLAFGLLTLWCRLAEGEFSRVLPSRLLWSGLSVHLACGGAFDGTIHERSKRTGLCRPIGSRQCSRRTPSATAGVHGGRCPAENSISLRVVEAKSLHLKFQLHALHPRPCRLSAHPELDEIAPSPVCLSPACQLPSCFQRHLAAFEA